MVIANFDNITPVERTQGAFAQAFADNLYYTRGKRSIPRRIMTCIWLWRIPYATT